jgi:hypothetical protein
MIDDGLNFFGRRIGQRSNESLAALIVKDLQSLSDLTLNLALPVVVAS